MSPVQVRPVPSYARIAQLVEQLICNQQVDGSSPSVGSTGGIPPAIESSFLCCWRLGTDEKCRADRMPTAARCAIDRKAVYGDARELFSFSYSPSI